MFVTLRKLLLLVLGLPFVLLGGHFLMDSTGTALTHWASASWTQTTATLVSVERISGPDQAWGNQTSVLYTYDFGGQTHEGTNICAMRECPEQGMFETLRAALDANRTVPVLVDPDHPERAMLHRHLHLPYFLLNLSVGLFCLFTGGSAVAFGVYMLRRDRAATKENP
ncbi:MAG: DUF3592 domain-containing protein [Deltaproteobacteria bacterium]|nr:DUF3592 domain-containing protein [Deltaproteobacteria bacterium]